MALKTIRKDRYLEQESEAQALHRFRREARAAGKLSHPGIVTVYDIGEDGGDVFIAMQYVEGELLRAKMRQAPRFAGTDLYLRLDEQFWRGTTSQPPDMEPWNSRITGLPATPTCDRPPVDLV